MEPITTEPITVDDLNRIDGYCEKANGSMTARQLERADLLAESRKIDVATAQELIYLRSTHEVYAHLPRLSQACREMIDERDAWKETAERHCRNEMFYHDIIGQLGPLLGPTVYTSDDGSVQDSVLALKVVGAVREMMECKQNQAESIKLYQATVETYCARFVELEAALVTQRRELGSQYDELNDKLGCVQGTATAEIERLEAERDALREAVQEFLNSGVELDDPRMGYVIMQVDKDAIKQARAALAPATAKGG